MTRRASRALSVAVTLVATGCVPANAGVREASTALRQRTGHALSWDPDRVEDGGLSAEARRLLARPLDPERAAQVALLENRALLAELAGLGVARAALVGAGMLPNPRIEGEVYVAEEADTSWAATATIGLAPLLRLPARRGAAAVALEAEALRVAGRAIELAFDARIAAVRHAADLRRVALSRTDLEATAAAFETARALAASGGGTALDLSLREAQYHEARLALADAEAVALGSRERLAVLMGVWGRDARWTVADRLPAPPEREESLDDLERRAVGRSLDLAAAGKQIEAAARRVGLTRWQGWLPDLQVGAAVEREPEGTRVGPAAALTVPLFDQGQGATDAAHAELRQLEHELVATAVRVRSAARIAGGRLQAARERANFFQTVLLPVRARIVREMQLEVNAMQAGIYPLLLARREEVSAAARNVEALADYWVARLRVQQLLAGRLPPDGAAEGGGQPQRSTSTQSEAGGH